MTHYLENKVPSWAVPRFLLEGFSEISYFEFPFMRYTRSNFGSDRSVNLRRLTHFYLLTVGVEGYYCT